MENVKQTTYISRLVLVLRVQKWGPLKHVYIYTTYRHICKPFLIHIRKYYPISLKLGTKFGPTNVLDEFVTQPDKNYRF